MGTTNVALSKPVTAITDRTFASSWFAYQGAPSYTSIAIDLGQTYAIGKLEFYPQQTFDSQIYGSTDGTTHTEITSGT